MGISTTALFSKPLRPLHRYDSGAMSLHLARIPRVHLSAERLQSDFDRAHHYSQLCSDSAPPLREPKHRKGLSEKPQLTPLYPDLVLLLDMSAVVHHIVQQRHEKPQSRLIPAFRGYEIALKLCNSSVARL